MDLVGIFKNKLTGNYFWLDCLDEDEVKEAKYFLDDDNAISHHTCVKSAEYDDMTGYVDALQNEEDLSDDELYVVTYFTFAPSCCLYQHVDMGITKQQIIDNVKAQKYVEGASYHTMGQMMYYTIKYGVSK